MKYVKGLIIAVLAMVLTISGEAFAGRGHGQKAGKCACPYSETCMNAASGVNIFENATAVTITGKVSVAAYQGDGLQVDNGTEIVTVYGMGPIWYWNSLGIERPAVGDAVTIEAYEVKFSDGSVKNIAAKITINGETPQSIELRDKETGAPLWRKGCGSGRGFKNCPGANGTCPMVQPVPSTDKTT